MMLETTSKEREIKALETMPQDISFAESVEKVCFLDKIETGLQQVDSSQIVPHKTTENNSIFASPSNIDWTVQALEDLESSADVFIAKLLDSLLMSIERIASIPHEGRIIPEFQQENLREIICFNLQGNDEFIHRVCYRIDRDRIQILTIFRASREVTQFDFPIPSDRQIHFIKPPLDRLFRKRT